MRPAVTFIVLSLCGLSGCLVGGARAVFVPTNPANVTLYPRTADDVAIVSTPPTRPFVELGFVEGSTEYTMTDDPHQDVLVQMRALAAIQGCQALLITGASNSAHLARAYGDAELGYHGVCLVFTDAEGQKPPAARPSTPLAQGSLFRDKEGNIHRADSAAAREA